MTAPFVGPQPFGSENTIYGRDTEISELRYLLGAKRIVLLHSPSGAGKTSLLWARNGLLNKLRNSGRFEVWGPARVNQPHGALTVDNRFAWSAINDFEKSRHEGVRPAQGLAGMSLASYISDRNPKRNPVLIFDQFEEVLRMDAMWEEPRIRFFEQLGEALHDPAVWAMFVIREDYLASLLRYARMIPTCLQNQYRIDFLRRQDQALDAVCRPLSLFHRSFQEGAAEQMLANLASMTVLSGEEYVEYVGDYVEPLQLQLVCADLWSRIRERDASIPIALDDFGDLSKALGDYYDAKVKRDDIHAERAIREWFDKRLIAPSGVRNLIRKEPIETAGLPNTVIEDLVRDSYLVRQETRAGLLWFELSHDRLMEPVRESNARWFDTQLAGLQRAAGFWVASGRSGSLVLSGQALAQAKEEIKARATDLSPLDQEFLKECEGTQGTFDGAKMWGCVAAAFGTVTSLFGFLQVLSWLMKIHNQWVQIAVSVVVIGILIGLLIYFVLLYLDARKPAERS